jgi:UDP:flavonoid glycosyltransferase YjiC (YdhE family)
MAIPLLARLESKSIVSLGQPNNQSVKKLGNCEIHGWLDAQERNKCMNEAKIIIFSGGHGTCFEVIKHRKPSVCIPTQPEQMGNARKLQELKCSIVAENEKQLKSAISEIEEKKEFYMDNVKKISEYSDRFRGLDRAVDVIEGIS